MAGQQGFWDVADRLRQLESAVRAAIEHPFAHQNWPMKLVIRTIRLACAEAVITLANMAGNMKRWC